MYSDDSWNSCVKFAIRLSAACALICSLAVGGITTLWLAPFIFIFVFALIVLSKAILDGATYVHNRISTK